MPVTTWITDDEKISYSKVDDTNGVIKYDILHVVPVFNAFTGGYDDNLVPYYESQTIECDAAKLTEEFENVEITKDYWKAWEYASGRKRKAINTNDTTN